MIEDINLVPDEPVFAARSLDALIQKWLDWCLNDLGEPDEFGILHSYTVSGYTSKMVHFRRWWATVGPSLDWQLRESDFLTFNRWLTYESGLSYNSRKDVLRRLSQMFKWAFRRSYIKRDYSIWIPEADGSAPLRIEVPLSSLHKLMQAAAESDNPRRNQAIIAICLGTGMRRAECCLLNIEDIQLSADGSGTIAIRHAKKTKGRDVQGRTAIFDHHTGQYIRAYLDAIARTAGPLFPGMWREKPMQPTSMGRIVNRLILDAGLKHQIQNLHDLRRMFVTVFCQHKNVKTDDKLLQLQVGHSSIEMTNLYNLSGVDTLQEEFVSPFAVMAEKGYRL